ncbi:hypothetical protein OROMI_030336 [Orobanche minor]
MNRFSGKNGSNMGCQQVVLYRKQQLQKSFMFEHDANITMIKDVDPMLDNITLQGRCISIWHSHKLNEAHNPYNLDLVLQDVQNSRIQVYIKKDWMFRFEPLFEVGKCYSISNFAIAENTGRLALLPFKYKISFYKGTIVTRIEPFDNNVNGFILEPFNRLLNSTSQYHEHEAVDVIGSVIAIGDIVPVMSAAGRKIRRTVVIEDDDSNQLDCTFWDNWATLWDEYAQKRESMGHVVFILQLGKAKYWDGTPAIYNALFGTKMFINRDLPKILSFRQRVKELPNYDEAQFKIELFTPHKPIVTIAEFFHGAVKKMVASIREREQKSHCIVYARIHKIHKESGWAYTACKECNKKVNVMANKTASSSGSRKAISYCEDHGQTLSQVSLFLQMAIFSHGQLYVSVSRVKSKKGLKVVAKKKGLKVLCCDKDGNYSNSTTNVVYKEVLFRI